MFEKPQSPSQLGGMSVNLCLTYGSEIDMKSGTGPSRQAWPVVRYDRPRAVGVVGYSVLENGLRYIHRDLKTCPSIFQKLAVRRYF